MRLTCTRKRLADLSAGDLEALQGLRAEYRSDADAGTAWLAEMQEAFLFRDSGGRLQAFFLLSETAIAVAGRDHVLVALSSFYAREPARGNRALPLAVMRYAGTLLLRFPRARWYTVALRVTPNGWLWLRGGMARVFTPQHADLRPFERELLDAFCRGYSAPDWNPERRTFKAPGFRRGVQASAAARAPELSAEYEAVLPGPGDALLCMGELSARNLWPLARRLLRRTRGPKRTPRCARA